MTVNYLQETFYLHETLLSLPPQATGRSIWKLLVYLYTILYFEYISVLLLFHKYKQHWKVFKSVRIALFPTLRSLIKNDIQNKLMIL